MRISRKTPRPVVVAQHGDRCMVALIVIRKAAAPGQTDAKAGEEHAAHHVAFRFLRLGADADRYLVDRQRHIGDHARETSRLLPERIVNRIRKRLVGIDSASSVRHIGGPQIHYAVGIGHRQRPK